ncbi:MAG: hypothetical protein HKO65_00020 [Gemmatimonadetes bacterium]|nr:hypothetical protein [Gemmatimonadota bacterium]NNM03458.1 hypothetical protein [Gemmatimonadota bacterium]
MRRFQDEGGVIWMASVKERIGDDYKGRFSFVMTPDDGAQDREVELEDIRWNSRRTAERTLKTMAESELKRRLRSATGRAA